MKLGQKVAEPSSLAEYRDAQPQATWDEMRNDPFYGGQQAYLDVKQTLLKGQRGLCAYCEIRITGDLTPETIHARRHEQRVEHFHPKEDKSGKRNWALHWPNLWVVCLGGSQAPPEGFPLDLKSYMPPLPENLSCDAFKDHQIKNGTPEPDLEKCAALSLPNHHYADTATLVAKTIEHLNLGCTRLKRSRSIAKAQLEKQIQQARKRSPGAAPQTVLLDLARRLFSHHTHTPWPEFFSLLRWRLGEPAETHLRAIHYGEESETKPTASAIS